MKRSTIEAEAGDAKCCQVSYSTFCKLRTELDKDGQTLLWLECEKGTSGKASKLRCKVCTKFTESKI